MKPKIIEPSYAFKVEKAFNLREGKDIDFGSGLRRVRILLVAEGGEEGSGVEFAFNKRMGVKGC